MTQRYYGKKSRSFTATDALWRLVRARARAEGVTIGEVVRRALWEYCGGR